MPTLLDEKLMVVLEGVQKGVQLNTESQLYKVSNIIDCECEGTCGGECSYSCEAQECEGTCTWD